MYLSEIYGTSKLTKEEWLDRKVEQLLEQGNEEFIKYDWFDDCIDWDRVHKYLLDIAEKAYTELLTEQQISNWESKQLEEY